MASDNEQFAWREIITRVFDGFPVEKDTSPEWLTNPDTGRRLKLNYFYPTARLAIRIEGLRGREQRLEPDEFEQAQQEEREQVRERLCEEQGVRLLRFNVYDEPKEIFSILQSGLSWAMRQAATDDLTAADKLALVDKLRAARAKLQDVRTKVQTSSQLTTWAELWIDRAYKESHNDLQPAEHGPIPRYAPNMRVNHSNFGMGRVIALTDEDGDQIVTVRFDSGEEKQFLAQLVTDKLRPV